MDFLSIVKRYVEHPSNVEAMTSFFEALANEKNPERIRGILPFDFERIAGPSLDRLIEILPDDVDLLLTAALWRYHFGLDENADNYLERAKRITPLDQRVLRIEIFFSYGQAIDHLRSLCIDALRTYPSDEWIRGILRKIDDTGKITALEIPPLELKWQAALVGKKGTEGVVPHLLP